MKSHPTFLSFSLLALAMSACSDGGASDPVDDLGYAGTGIAVTIAPLDLPGVTDACYSFDIRNQQGQRVVARGGVVDFGGGGVAGQGGDGGPTVDDGAPAVHPDGAALPGTTSAPLCGSRFGAGGEIAYVAPCDASAGNEDHSVTLWVNSVCAGGSGWETAGASPCEPLPGFVNPCGAEGCTVTARCVENADVPVSFNFTVMASAQQGFFDVAVNFDNIFCSAKLDTCYDIGTDAEREITLLFDPDTGARIPTAVLALACTGGFGGDDDETFLHLGYVNVVCGSSVTTLNLSTVTQEGNQTQAGNQSPEASGIVWAAYFGAEDLSGPEGSWNKQFFNVAVAGLGDGCSLSWTATASNGQTLGPAGVTGPGVYNTYPVISFGPQPVTSDDGDWICSENPLNDDDGTVTTGPVPCSTPGGCIDGPCVTFQDGQFYPCNHPPAPEDASCDPLEAGITITSGTESLYLQPDGSGGFVFSMHNVGGDADGWVQGFQFLRILPNAADGWDYVYSTDSTDPTVAFSNPDLLGPWMHEDELFMTVTCGGSTSVGCAQIQVGDVTYQWTMSFFQFTSTFGIWQSMGGGVMIGFYYMDTLDPVGWYFAELPVDPDNPEDDLHLVGATWPPPDGAIVTTSLGEGAVTFFSGYCPD